MSVLMIAALALASNQAATALDLRQVEGLGTVEISTPGGPRLTIEATDPEGGTTVRELELDLLGLEANVVEARVSRFLGGRGLAIGLVVEDGARFTYHMINTCDFVAQSERARTNERADEGSAGASSDERAAVVSPSDWLLTQPIFESGAPRYRVVEVHNEGSDALEITFRRGLPGPDRLDERIFVETCRGSVEPLMKGRSWLIEAAGARSVR